MLTATSSNSSLVSREKLILDNLDNLHVDKKDDEDMFCFVYDVSLSDIEAVEEKISIRKLEFNLQEEPSKIVGNTLEELGQLDMEKFEVTDRDELEMTLRATNGGGGKDEFKNSFKKTKDVKVLVENNKNHMGFVSVGDILEKTIANMEPCIGGMVYRWTYRKRSCYALLGWIGVWNLYAIAPMKYKIDARPRTIYDTYVNFLAWDDDNYMYEVMLDMTQNVMLPGSPSDEAKPGSTFKDLSYCVAFVNQFVDRIRRG